MSECRPEELRYHRSRFTARLPLDRLYSPSHYWIKDAGDGTHRVGFTRFAKRMLGDIVEFNFDLEPGDAIAVGQTIGYVEAFKAVSDIFAIASGSFGGHNRALDDDLTLIDHDPHGAGWLYQITGEPDPACIDAHGYAALLNEHIDRLLGEGHHDE
jgi:glycine cleavage system H protein